MSNFNHQEVIEINGRNYTVGYKKERVNGDVSLGVSGDGGAIYMVEWFAKTHGYSDLVNISTGRAA